MGAVRSKRLAQPGVSEPASVERVPASWFETRGVAALLTMRVLDLILRSRALRGVSKDVGDGLSVWRQSIIITFQLEFPLIPLHPFPQAYP